MEEIKDYNLMRLYEIKKAKRNENIFWAIFAITLIIFIAGCLLYSKLETITIQFLSQNALTIFLIIDFICAIVSFNLARGSKRMQEIYTAATVTCPNCKSIHMTAQVDENDKTYARYKSFKCNKCKTKCDNSQMLKNVEEVIERWNKKSEK